MRASSDCALVACLEVGVVREVAGQGRNARHRGETASKIVGALKSKRQSATFCRAFKQRVRPG